MTRYTKTYFNLGGVMLDNFKPLKLSILISLLGYSILSNAAYPFADKPLHWQNETTITTSALVQS